MSAPEPKEIREAYSDFKNEWQDVRDEAMADMQAISPGGPWTSEDRQQRMDAGRPCVHLDQINQYLNQTTGNVRKNKRAIKAMPKGDGANDKDAKNRSNLIMGIEERSQAQPIYLNAFECMIARSYGFAVIRTEYKDNSSFEQEIIVKPIMNPDCVLITPHYNQPDASDIKDGFLLELVPKKRFENDYPDAEVTDFSGDLTPGLSDWIKDKFIQKAEYWRVEEMRSKLFLIETKKGPVIFTEDEWKAAKKHGASGEIKREREIKTPKVMQYMTNGLEILEENPWAGSRIPIISCLGPERWTTEGGTAKRSLLSMVRFARDPQMLLDFLASGECEAAGKIPKLPFVGAKGQFESDQETWDELNQVPHAYAQYDAKTDITGDAILPPPTYQNYTPDFPAWEAAKDAASRALQSAMGISPLPDAAQRRNQKSGVALEKIDDMESLGAFHFVDRYENCFLHNMGWQINELITPILDTQREMPVTQPDGSRSLIHVVGNTSHPIDQSGAYEVQGLDDDHIHTGKGEFDVTISTGPSYASEREEQSSFVDQLLDEIGVIAGLQPGSPAAKVLALAIKMRPDLGPIGEQIAEVFDPPPPDPNMPPQAQAALQALQAQLQQAQQENAALHMEHAGKVLEQQTKLIIQQMKEDGDNQRAQLANDIKVLLAEIAAKAQSASERAQMYQEFMIENHGAAHEAALQAMSHQHSQELAQQSATLQSQTQPDQGQQQNQGSPQSAQ
jgi:hypothetical protein